ncbi:hypothetical protein [Cohnella phaseoli]|uniref:Uncharacterized protein n=1 Tax=Cohnella phaseoli TaxID=456490 RepID=A0A3D9KIJ0_9BACL|nr:hypothetical protein [Cohnella phaseoli]RED86199.1 hypothetical protein DFP98_10350 [Cohnella phaseoli]
MKVTHEDGFTLIEYAEGKRPLKVTAYVIDCFDRDIQLSHIVKYVEAAANAPVHVAKMEPTKFYALVERLATTVCREFSPTRNWGVTKPEIRGAVLFVLYAAIKAGKWPVEYDMTDTTFVQYEEAGL